MQCSAVIVPCHGAAVGFRHGAYQTARGYASRTGAGAQRGPRGRTRRKQYSPSSWWGLRPRRCRFSGKCAVVGARRGLLVGGAHIGTLGTHTGYPTSVLRVLTRGNLAEESVRVHLRVSAHSLGDQLPADFKQANKQTSKQANKQTSKQANKQKSNQTNTRASQRRRTRCACACNGRGRARVGLQR